MVRDHACVALVLLSVVSAQSSAEPVRVPIGHLQHVEALEDLPRLTALAKSPPMLALGPRNRGRPDPKLLDLVANALGIRSGQRAKVGFANADIAASCGGLKPAEVRAAVLDEIAAFAPVVTLEISVFGSAPAPSPVVLAPGDDSSLPRRALHSRSIRCTDASPVTVQFGATVADRLRLRVQPHLLAGPTPRTALLFEFERECTDASGRRRWTAGTASAVARVDGKVVLTLADRMIAVRATHSRRPIGSRRIIGIPWSILTTRSCRTIPSLGGKGQALLEFASSSPVSNPDVLMTYIKDATMQGQWDGALYADSSPTRMLLGSAAPKLLAEATRTIDMTIAELTEPWTETATVECRMTTTAKGGTAVIQLPTMAGRTSFLLHTDGDGSATKGALFALHWYPDLTERDVPRRFCALGRGELTGFTVPVGGEATASGAATGFDRDSIAKSGRTSLVGSSSIDLWIVR